MADASNYSINGFLKIWIPNFQEEHSKAASWEILITKCALQRALEVYSLSLRGAWQFVYLWAHDCVLSSGRPSRLALVTQLRNPHYAIADDLSYNNKVLSWCWLPDTAVLNYAVAYGQEDTYTRPTVFPLGCQWVRLLVLKMRKRVLRIISKIYQLLMNWRVYDKWARCNKNLGQLSSFTKENESCFCYSNPYLP